MLPIVTLHRCIARLRLQEIEGDRARFRSLGANTMADCLLGIIRHECLELGLGFSCSRNACRVLGNAFENSAQALDELMSTMRMASIRGRGGSTPNRRG